MVRFMQMNRSFIFFWNEIHRHELLGHDFWKMEIIFNQIHDVVADAARQKVFLIPRLIDNHDWQSTANCDWIVANGDRFWRDSDVERITKKEEEEETTKSSSLIGFVNVHFHMMSSAMNQWWNGDARLGRSTALCCSFDSMRKFISRQSA